MKKLNTIKIAFIFTSIACLTFAFTYSSAQDNPQAKTETARLNTVEVAIEGEGFIKDGALFLVDAREKLYKIVAETNPNVYDSLFSLTKQNEAQNKGLKATLTGRLGKSHAMIERSFKYSESGLPESGQAQEIRYQDLDVVSIKDTADSILKKDFIRRT